MEVYFHDTINKSIHPDRINKVSSVADDIKKTADTSIIHVHDNVSGQVNSINFLFVFRNNLHLLQN
jgi:hypothetical protein